MTDILTKGTRAPGFTLHVTPDQTVSLDDLRGRPVILAFYPADWSPVCGDQMALYNEVLPEFRKYGAELLGISVDGAWCHRRLPRIASCIFRCSRTSSRRARSRRRTASTATPTAQRARAVRDRRRGHDPLELLSRRRRQSRRGRHPDALEALPSLEKQDGEAQGSRNVA